MERESGEQVTSTLAIKQQLASAICSAIRTARTNVEEVEDGRAPTRTEDVLVDRGADVAAAMLYGAELARELFTPISQPHRPYD